MLEVLYHLPVQLLVDPLFGDEIPPHLAFYEPISIPLDPFFIGPLVAGYQMAAVFIVYYCSIGVCLYHLAELPRYEGEDYHLHFGRTVGRLGIQSSSAGVRKQAY